MTVRIHLMVLSECLSRYHRNTSQDTCILPHNMLSEHHTRYLNTSQDTSGVPHNCCQKITRKDITRIPHKIPVEDLTTCCENTTLDITRIPHEILVEYLTIII